MRDAARQYLPGLAGGGRRAGDQRAQASDSRLGARLSTESVLAASKAVGGGAAGVAAGAAGASGVGSGARAGGAKGAGGSSGGSGAGGLRRARGGGSGRAYSPPPLASRQGAVAEAGGLRRPSWRQDHFDAEMLEASVREQRQPVSGEQARQARDALPASTQGAMQSLVADYGPRARQHLAHQAMGEWSPDEREAIRTLAAASPEVRAQAFSDAGGSMSAFGESADPKPTPGRDGRRDTRARAGPRPGWEWWERRVGTHAARSNAPGAGAWLVNPAPAHLEAKLRFGWDFTVGQIAAIVGGILIGFAWANWLSPIHGIGAAVTGVYVGGLPVAAGFVASQTEFDLGAVVVSAVRWRRAGGRFVAGAGVCTGYIVVRGEDEARDGEEALSAVFDPELLWADAGPVPASRNGRLAAGAPR